ncbi:MAG: NAD-dependent succinate-semialdehyde dehydrogenase [Balneolaceae bacterium]
MNFKSVNPYTGETIATYKEHTEEEINEKLTQSDAAFRSWREISIPERSRMMNKAADVLIENLDSFAGTITEEMGKPIGESKAEIKKCAWVCEYYAENAERFLADELIKTDASESFISFDPIGCVFAIMPWNYPFWQVFRFAAPALMAGNTAVLKHASNVTGCALHIEQVFSEAGFPVNTFQSLIMHHDKTEQVISHDAVKAVTLTGSEKAGVSVARIAGKNLKKTVLELGGSNAFIVAEDADMEKAVQTAVKARMQNSGQSCIAAKRFILAGNAGRTFLPGFIDAAKALKAGDPMDESTEIGPLARKDLAENLHKQSKNSIEKGAEVLLGGNYKDAFHEPTILGNVIPGMPAFDEETFGPLAAITTAENLDEAFELAARSKFGLGVTLFTRDIENGRKYTHKVPDGAFFINELVKSDPRLPFGGTKQSGYGRELSREGIREFVNKKTVYVAE